MNLTSCFIRGTIINMEKCRVPGCSMKFRDVMQRNLHEATTWHCIICGFSDGSDLMRITKVEELECTLCVFDRVGNPEIEPKCTTILVDFVTKKHKVLQKKEDKHE